MAAVTSLSSTLFVQKSASSSLAIPKSYILAAPKTASFRVLTCGSTSMLAPYAGRKFSHLVRAVAQGAPASDQAAEAARRLYVGNIPRTVTNDELAAVVGEHGSVEKAEVMYDKYSGRSRRFAFVTMTTVEDANAAAEKLNGTEIGGRTIKVNITEKPLQVPDLSLQQAEDSKFIDSPYKVYVGNLAKTVTTEILINLFAEKGTVLSARVSHIPGTSKSSGFGFISFSSEEEVEAAIADFNNTLLEGQKIRVNKA